MNKKQILKPYLFFMFSFNVPMLSVNPMCLCSSFLSAFLYWRQQVESSWVEWNGAGHRVRWGGGSSHPRPTTYIYIYVYAHIGQQISKHDPICESIHRYAKICTNTDEWGHPDYSRLVGSSGLIRISGIIQINTDCWGHPEQSGLVSSTR